MEGVEMGGKYVGGEVHMHGVYSFGKSQKF